MICIIYFWYINIKRFTSTRTVTQIRFWLRLQKCKNTKPNTHTHWHGRVCKLPSVIFPIRSYLELPHWFHRFVESVASAMLSIKRQRTGGKSLPHQHVAQIRLPLAIKTLWVLSSSNLADHQVAGETHRSGVTGGLAVRGRRAGEWFRSFARIRKRIAIIYLYSNLHLLSFGWPLSFKKLTQAFICQDDFSGLSAEPHTHTQKKTVQAAEYESMAVPR